MPLSSSSSGRFTVAQQKWLEEWCETTWGCPGNGPIVEPDLLESGVEELADFGVAKGVWRHNEHSIGHIISFCCQWLRKHSVNVD